MSDSKDLTPSEKMRAALPAKPRSLHTNPLLYFLTGLLASLLLGACCICGIGVWWFRPQIHDNPQRAEELTAQIVDIRIPEAFQPRGTIEWDIAFLLSLRGVYYERYVGDATLTLLEVHGRFTSEESIHRHIRQTLLDEGAGGTELTVDKSKTTREVFEISGQEVPFTFDIARDPRTNETFHLVEGSFEGKQGVVLLSLRVDEAHWKDDVALEPTPSTGSAQPRWVIQMLSSINAPHGKDAEKSSVPAGSVSSEPLQRPEPEPSSASPAPKSVAPATSDAARPTAPPPVPTPSPVPSL